MMGPRVMMFTRNHASWRIDIPMNRQGNTNEEPIVIGNDVWIGAGVIILGGGKNWKRSDNRSRLCGYKIGRTIFGGRRKSCKICS